MPRNQKKVLASGMMVLLMVFLNAFILQQGLVSNEVWYKLTFITIPLLLLSIVAFRRKFLL